MPSEKSITDRLNQYLKSNGMKPAEFARRSGLPLENVYKWVKGTKPSNPEDYKKIESFISGNLETVPREIVRHPAALAPQDPVDWKEKYYVLMEKYNNLLEKVQEGISLDDFLKIVEENRKLLNDLYEHLIPDGKKDKGWILTYQSKKQKDT